MSSLALLLLAASVVVASLVLVLILQGARKYQLVQLALATGLAAALVGAAAGNSMRTNAANAMDSVAPAQLAIMAGKARGRGALVLLFIAYGPEIVMAVSLLVALKFLTMLTSDEVQFAARALGKPGERRGVTSTRHTDGFIYLDDRMFLLHIAKCTVRELEDLVETTIFHGSAPAEHLWCVTTYRNTESFPAVRVDHFWSYGEAREFFVRVAPTTPLISLGGKSPASPLGFQAYIEEQRRSELRDYDHTVMHAAGAKDPCEVIVTPRR